MGHAMTGPQKISLQRPCRKPLKKTKAKWSALGGGRGTKQHWNTEKVLLEKYNKKEQKKNSRS